VLECSAVELWPSPSTLGERRLVCIENLPGWIRPHNLLINSPFLPHPISPPHPNSFRALPCFRPSHLVCGYRGEISYSFPLELHSYIHNSDLILSADRTIGQHQHVENKAVYLLNLSLLLLMFLPNDVCFYSYPNFIPQPTLCPLPHPQGLPRLFAIYHPRPTHNTATHTTLSPRASHSQVARYL